jgi:hypothetical protein
MDSIVDLDYEEKRKIHFFYRDSSPEPLSP